jgi:hypothetical protein
VHWLLTNSDLIGYCKCRAATPSIPSMPTSMCQCSDCPFGQVHVEAAKFKVSMNMFFKNVKNSVSKVLNGKGMICHQELEEIENRLTAVEARIESCDALRAANSVKGLVTSGLISSDSNHFLSVRSRMLVASYQTEAEMISCLSVLSNKSGVDEASKTSGS